MQTQDQPIRIRVNLCCNALVALSGTGSSVLHAGSLAQHPAQTADRSRGSPRTLTAHAVPFKIHATIWRLGGQRAEARLKILAVKTTAEEPLVRILLLLGAAITPWGLATVVSAETLRSSIAAHNFALACPLGLCLEVLALRACLVRLAATPTCTSLFRLRK